MLKKGDKGYDDPGFMVRATKPGFFGVSMREPGDVFRIQFARHFADHKADHGCGWMEKVDGPVPKRRGTGNQEPRGAKPPPQDPSERDLRMSQVDQMAEDAMAEDQTEKFEAEVI